MKNKPIIAYSADNAPNIAHNTLTFRIGWKRLMQQYRKAKHEKSAKNSFFFQSFFDKKAVTSLPQTRKKISMTK
jgi:hypothetical protein